MNIGDKVRSKHSKEQGFITKYISDKIVEVEIEDGFRIQFATKDIVAVAQDEDIYFGNTTKTQSKASTANLFNKETIADRGVFIAFKHQNDKNLEIYILNNTDLEVAFTFGEEEKAYKGVAIGILNPRSYKKVSEANLDKFENWAVFVCQMLFHSHQAIPFKPALFKRVVCRANTFFKAKQKAPLLNTEAYLFQLDEEQKINPEVLKDKLTEKSTFSPAETVRISVPKYFEIDLHVEKIAAKYPQLNKGNELAIQLQEFDKVLDEAIAGGTKELTVIHGVGNGTLRTEIHRRASKHPHVHSFKDAQKEKFGYGATTLILK
jgi:hypothetical protein